MTTATALDRSIDSPAASRISSHGVDRVVENFAVALLNWSRTRTARAAQTHSEHSLSLQQLSLEEKREADALRLTQRLGL